MKILDKENLTESQLHALKIHKELFIAFAKYAKNYYSPMKVEKAWDTWTGVTPPPIPKIKLTEIE